jgi:hypothetical protein
VTITARDLAGNEVSRSVSIILDRTDPGSVDQGPQGSDCSLAGQIFIVPDEALASCEIRLDGVLLLTEFDGRSWNASFLLGPGSQHNVTATVRDLAGNIAVLYWDFGTTEMIEFKGQIIGSDGLPISGATITAGNYSCVTDERGNFVLVAPYDIGKAEVTASGKADLSIELTLTDLGSISMTSQDQWPSWIPIIFVAATVTLVVVWFVARRARRRK